MPDNRTLFTDNFHVLVALVTHLSMSASFESRTVPAIATELHLDPNVVRTTFNNFPSFFRRSRNTDAAGEHFFEVHQRYARRLPTPPGGTRPLTPPLDSAELGAMFDLIANMVKNESQLLDLRQRAEIQMAEQRQKSRTMVATLIAAIIGAVAAIISALLKGSGH